MAAAKKPKSKQESPSAPLASDLYPSLKNLASAPGGLLESLMLTLYLWLGDRASHGLVDSILGLEEGSTRGRCAGFARASQEWKQAGQLREALLPSRPPPGKDTPREELEGPLASEWLAALKLPADRRLEEQQRLVNEEALRVSLLMIAKAKSMLAVDIDGQVDSEGRFVAGPKWTYGEARALLETANAMQRKAADMDRIKVEIKITHVEAVKRMIVGIFNAGQTSLPAIVQELQRIGVEAGHIEQAIPLARSEVQLLEE